MHQEYDTHVAPAEGTARAVGRLGKSGGGLDLKRESERGVCWIDQIY